MGWLIKAKEQIPVKWDKFIKRMKIGREKAHEKKIYNRIVELQTKISEEMPELNELPLHEQVRTYYEIKGIESQEYNNKITRGLTVIIILLTFYQFILLVNQTNLMDRQTKLSEQSTVPYEPELRIWSEYSPLELSTQFLMNHKGQRERVSICIKNVGQTSTGHIYYHWQNNWTHNFNSNNIHPGIEPGDTVCDWLELSAKDCFGDPEGCTDSIIPQGWIDLNLSLKCDYCVPNELIKNFEACIWKGASTMCRE